MTVATDTQVAVRVAEWRDLPAVLTIESASFSDPWNVDAFETALTLPHMRFYVAEDRGAMRGRRTGSAVSGASAVVGYVVALVAGDEGEIADLAVAPGVRRRGIGALLLDHAVAEAAGRGVRAVYLEVRESNRSAIALYASRGFAAVGRRRGYYQRPSEDALLLRREIAPT